MKGFLLILFYLLLSPSQALEARVTKKKIRRMRRTLRQKNTKHTRILRLLSASSTKPPKTDSTKSPTGSSKAPSSTRAPATSTKSPTPSSTKRPAPSTKAPTTPDVIPSVETCELEGHLAFEYDSPYDAPYYGVHEKYLTVYRNDLTNACSGTHQESWCVYENTEEGYYTSYLEIFPNATDEEAIMTSETITSLDAFDTVHFFCATHIFQNMDFNTTSDDWRDHLMAPTLRLKKNQESIGKEYKNVVDIPTHIEDEINPEFPDEYCVEVKCNSSCDCNVSPFVIQME
jgi:hypothetical protein